jgi:hypothetical protein
MDGRFRIRADEALEALALQGGRCFSIYWGYNVVG